LAGTLAWFDFANRRRNIELGRWNQNGVALHCLCGNSDWKENRNSDCGKKTFVKGVSHTSPPLAGQLRSAILISFVPERKLLMPNNSERSFESEELKLIPSVYINRPQPYHLSH
jgi:hypothetical protein